MDGWMDRYFIPMGNSEIPAVSTNFRQHVHAINTKKFIVVKSSEKEISKRFLR